MILTHPEIFANNNNGNAVVKVTAPQATGGTAKYVSISTKLNKVVTSENKVRIYRGTKA
jgi:hypothetical protein